VPKFPPLILGYHRHRFGVSWKLWFFKNHMKKFTDAIHFVHDKNDSCYGLIEYIRIGKTLKITELILYCLPRVRLASFPVLYMLEQLSANPLIPKETQFTKILACQNGPKESQCTNFSYILCWAFLEHLINGVQWVHSLLHKHMRSDTHRPR